LNEEAPDRLIAEIRVFEVERERVEFTSKELTSFIEARHKRPRIALACARNWSGSTYGVVNNLLVGLRRLGKVSSRSVRKRLLWKLENDGNDAQNPSKTHVSVVKHYRGLMEKELNGEPWLALHAEETKLARSQQLALRK